MARKRILAAALLAAAFGCGEEAERVETVAIDRVPADLMKVANETLPGIKFTVAHKIKVNGEDAYEIQGKDPRGKIREVEVSTVGKVLEVE
jgi:hypothetical protein